MFTKRTLLISAVMLGALVAAYAALRDHDRPLPAGPAKPSAPIPLRAEGRLAAYPGVDVTLGTDLGGTLLKVYAEGGQAIHRGQLLVLIDPRTDEAARRESQARVKELDASMAFQEREVERHASLQRAGVLSREALEQSRTQLALSQAQRDAARATTERLGVVLDKRRITAPFDGVLLSRLAQPGETVAPGASLLRVARMDRVRVEAEIDEFDLSGVKVGARVAVRAEGMGGSWAGRVEEVPSHVVGRKLKPQDPARPSDTRILLVKVALEQPTPLKLGQRVELELEP